MKLKSWYLIVFWLVVFWLVAFGLVVFGLTTGDAYSQTALAAEGDVWITVSDQDVGAGQNFDIEIRADTGGKEIGAFNLHVDFSAADVAVDTSRGADGFAKGADATSYVMMANPIDMAGGQYRFAGITVSGHAKGSNVHLVTIHAAATPGFTSGTSDLKLTLNELTDKLGKNFSTGAVTGESIHFKAVEPGPGIGAGALAGVGSGGQCYITTLKRWP